MPKRITVQHSRATIYERRMCDPEDAIVVPGVELEITYAEGMERDALRTLDRAYADIKRQITGMTAIVPALTPED